jgi:hypothetical protein
MLIVIPPACSPTPEMVVLHMPARRAGIPRGWAIATAVTAAMQAAVRAPVIR